MRGAGLYSVLASGKNRSVQVIEPPGDLARQLQVLGLVVAHGNAVGLDAQDVRGLKHGIGEQARVDVLLVLGGLVLELRHPFQGPDGGAGAEDPGQFHRFGHVGLHEERTAVRIETACDAHRGGVQHGLPHGIGVVLDGDGVVIHDAVDAVVPRDLPGPVGNGAEVIPYVNVAGRLDAAVKPGRFAWLVFLVTIRRGKGHSPVVRRVICLFPFVPAHARSCSFVDLEGPSYYVACIQKKRCHDTWSFVSLFDPKQTC